MLKFVSDVFLNQKFPNFTSEEDTSKRKRFQQFLSTSCLNVEKFSLLEKDQLALIIQKCIDYSIES